MDRTALGDRQKMYEGRYTNQKLLPMVPALARLDGRAFHTFTRGMRRPYDERMSRLMIDTLVFLMEETGARCGYTQSDEISLVWLEETLESKIFFAGRVLKMTSCLSGLASAFFSRKVPEVFPEKEDELPTFDCRVWNVPSELEATNYFIWREQDATRNSVAMAAQSFYSHKELFKKKSSDMQEMLWQKGVNWNDYPRHFKRGTYTRKRTVDRPMTPTEIALLPPKHQARFNPDLQVHRTMVVEEDFPPLKKITNREDVVFRGAEPILSTPLVG